MARPKVLIVGAGIAGPAFAHQLAQRGFEPTVVELAGELRSGGSAVVVRGPAIQVAERMGVMPTCTRPPPARPRSPCWTRTAGRSSDSRRTRIGHRQWN